jgi:hypothetical protein
MKPPKYFSSVLLRFRSYDRFLYRFADRNELDELVEELTDRVRNCMIYLICRRPTISIIPDTFKKNGDQFEFELKYRAGGRESTYRVKTPKGLIKDFGGKIEVSDYPHNSILNYDGDNNLIVDILISNQIHLLQGVPESISNLEVLYIGKGTSDCAIDRLDGHSTLERVLADVLKHDPSNEVAILIYNLKMQKDILSSPNIGKNAEIRGDEAKKHFEQIIAFHPGIDEQTEIAEALLIDYFKTDKYNLHFTNGLSSDLKTLKSVYELDFDAVVVELNNENIGYLNVFSKSVKPGFHHQATLDIREREGRISLLNLK